MSWIQLPRSRGLILIRFQVRFQVVRFQVVVPGGFRWFQVGRLVVAVAGLIDLNVTHDGNWAPPALCCTASGLVCCLGSAAVLSGLVFWGGVWWICVF